MVRRGQGAFEYILVLGGVLLIVMVSMLLLRSTVSSSGSQVNQSFLTYSQSADLANFWAAGRGSAVSFSDAKSGGVVTSIPVGSAFYFFNDGNEPHSYELFSTTGATLQEGTVQPLDGTGYSFSSPGDYNYSWDNGANNSIDVDEGAPTPTPTPTPPPEASFSCGDNVTQSATLANDVTGCNSNGLVIAADNVVLDCNGHSIQGWGDYGIYVQSADNVVVRNCVVSEFMTGIYGESSNNLFLQDNQVSLSNVEGVRLLSSNGLVLDCGGRSISSVNWGLYVDGGSDAQVSDCTITGGGGPAGIYANNFDGLSVQGCTVANPGGYAIDLLGTRDVLIKDSTLSDGAGFQATSCENVTLQNTDVRSPTFYAAFLQGCSQCSVLEGRLESSSGVYMSASPGNVFFGNEFVTVPGGSPQFYFETSPSLNFSSNTLDQVTYGFGLYGMPNAVVSKNTIGNPTQYDAWYVDNSPNSVISENSAVGLSQIYVTSSNGLQLLSNDFSSSPSGLYYSGANYSVVSGNNFSRSLNAWIEYSWYLAVSNNQFDRLTQTGGDAAAFFRVYHGVVSSNNFSQGTGIRVYSFENVTAFDNDASYSRDAALGFNNDLGTGSNFTGNNCSFATRASFLDASSALFENNDFSNLPGDQPFSAAHTNSYKNNNFCNTAYDGTACIAQIDLGGNKYSGTELVPGFCGFAKNPCP